MDLQTKLEQTSFDLTTHPLSNDSPVLCLKTRDKTNTDDANTIEQAEHTTSSKVHAPPDNTTETPPPLKNVTKL